MNLDLSFHHPELQDRAEANFEAGNVLGFLMTANRGELNVVLHNICPLKERGIYEAALFEAYTGCSSNNHSWPITALQRLFDLADREKLMAAGDPLPAGERFTIYRGVAGKNPYRKVRSFTWTLDYERAEWFANRFNVCPLADPAVYRAVVRREQVLAYANDREEQEIVCRPSRCERMPVALGVAA